MSSKEDKEKLNKRYNSYEVYIEDKENNITCVKFKATKGMTPKEAFDFIEELRDYI